LVILDQPVIATANEQYEFVEWDVSTFTAKFKLKSRILKFTNATGLISGDSAIAPSSTSEFSLTYEEEIEDSFMDGVLKYVFTDSSGICREITYVVPVKYRVKDTDNPGIIKNDETITPKVELKKYDITLKTNKGTSIQAWEDVVYGTVITIKLENLREETGAKVTTSYSSTSKEYSHNTIVGVNVNSESYDENTTITKTLTENLNIIIQVRDIYTITMNNAQTVGQIPTGYITSASKTGDNTLKVIEGENITCTRNGQNLTYASSTATLNYTTTYTAIDGYVVYIAETQVGSIQPTSSTSITPKYYFYACRVTISNTNTDAVTMKLNGAETDLIVFNVSYETEILFTVSQINSIFTYTYAFTQPDRTTKIITFTTKGTQYAMGTLGWENEERIWATGIADIKFDGDTHLLEEPDVVPPARIDDIQLIISPTFGLKSYNVDLQ